MPIDGEPRNGDYAAYVDRLVNGGKASPGQVLKDLAIRPARKARRGATLQPSLPLPQNDAAGWPSLPPAAAGGPGAAEAANGDTLSSRQQQRRSSLGTMVSGGVLGLVGLNMILGSLGGEADSLLPGIFILVFAWVLMRAGKKNRAAKTPLKKLPPLSTVSQRDLPPR